MILNIKKQASELRNFMCFGNTEAINIKSLLIKQNVITVFKILSEQFSGMAVKTGDHKFMLVNSNHSIGRQHFTICHEIYHLFIDKNFTPHHCSTGVYNKDKMNEYFADVFASYFLMSDDGIVNLIPYVELGKDRVTIETILKIENYFLCSRSALLFRLKELKLVSNKAYEKFNNQVKFTAKQYGYPVDLYEPGNNGLVLGNYGTHAKQLFDNEKISEGHYMSLMNAIGIDVFNGERHGDTDY